MFILTKSCTGSLNSSMNFIYTCQVSRQLRRLDMDNIKILMSLRSRYITIFITVWTFSLNLCKRIKYAAFCFNILCFGNLNLPLLLKTATLWTLLLPWLTRNTKNKLICNLYLALFVVDFDEEGSMETFEQIHDKVTKDFEQVAPSLVKDDTR